MQTRILQVQSELTDLGTELEAKRRNWRMFVKEVNELTAYHSWLSQGVEAAKRKSKNGECSSDE